MFDRFSIRGGLRNVSSFAFFTVFGLLFGTWGAAPGRALVCPDLEFKCALGDTFEIETHFAFPHHCEANGSVQLAASRYCDMQGCVGALQRTDGCSIPVPGMNAIYNGLFKSACDLHDICYDTVGTTQRECDANFYDNLMALCRLPGLGKLRFGDCYLNANLMWAAVSAVGKSHFVDGQKWASVNCSEVDVPPLPAPLVDDPIRLRPKKSGDLALCIDAGRIDDGMPAHLCPDAGVPSQRWTIHRETKDYYSLKADLSEKCLDVKDGSKADGGAIQQWVCSTFDNSNQRWALLLDGSDGWVLRAKVSGKCLQYNTQNNTVEQRSCSGGDDQRWFLENDLEEGLPPLGKDLQIVGVDSDKAIGIEGSKMENGAGTVLVYTDRDQKSQIWQIETAPSGFFYHLKVKHSNKCLDLKDGGTVQGTRVQQVDCDDDDPNQLWDLEEVSGGWLIMAQVSGFCLDAKGIQAAAGTEVYSWPCTAAKNQVWQLKPLQ